VLDEGARRKRVVAVGQSETARRASALSVTAGQTRQFSFYQQPLALLSRRWLSLSPATASLLACARAALRALLTAARPRSPASSLGARSVPRHTRSSRAISGSFRSHSHKDQRSDQIYHRVLHVPSRARVR